MYIDTHKAHCQYKRLLNTFLRLGVWVVVPSRRLSHCLVAVVILAVRHLRRDLRAFMRALLRTCVLLTVLAERCSVAVCAFACRAFSTCRTQRKQSCAVGNVVRLFTAGCAARCAPVLYAFLFRKAGGTRRTATCTAVQRGACTLAVVTQDTDGLHAKLGCHDSGKPRLAAECLR